MNRVKIMTALLNIFFFRSVNIAHQLFIDNSRKIKVIHENNGLHT